MTSQLKEYIGSYTVGTIFLLVLPIKCKALFRLLGLCFLKAQDFSREASLEVVIRNTKEEFLTIKIEGIFPPGCKYCAETSVWRCNLILLGHQASVPQFLKSSLGLSTKKRRQN